MENIKNKIKKLLAVVERAGSENEAAIAMEKVQDLLIKYQLSLSDIDIDDQSFLTDVSYIGLRQAWISSIYAAVCELYFCVSTYKNDQKTKKKRISITGDAVNVETAKYIINCVVSLGIRLSVQHTLTMRDKRIAGNCFKNGFAVGITRRCDEMIKTKSTNTTDSTALVVANLYQVAEKNILDWLKKSGQRIVNGRAPSLNTSDISSARAGLMAADKANLSMRGIGGDKQSRFLIGG